MAGNKSRPGGRGGRGSGRHNAREKEVTISDNQIDGGIENFKEISARGNRFGGSRDDALEDGPISTEIDESSLEIAETDSEIVESLEDNLEIVRKTYICLNCENYKGFDLKKGFEKHNGRVHKFNPVVKCFVCFNIFTRPADKDAHVCPLARRGR